MKTEIERKPPKPVPNPCPRCGTGNGPICDTCWAEMSK